MRKHALTSCSSAYRWMECPASARINAEAPKSETPATVDGSTAHALAEIRLRERLALLSRKPLNDRELQPIPEGVTPEMEEAVDGYVDYVTSRNADVYIEYPLEHNEELFGTADCVLYDGVNLEIIDFKYGIGKLVRADSGEVGNQQLALYAYMAARSLNCRDLQTVKLSIYQPRLNNVSEFTVDYEKLCKWFTDRVLPAMEKARTEGCNEFNSGSWCDFCEIKTICRHRIVRLFNSLPEKRLDILTDEEIDELLPNLADLIKAAEGVVDYAKNKAAKGWKWGSFKLVAGAKKRVWEDEEKAALALKFNGIEPYKQTIISPADAEKKLGKKGYANVCELVTYKQNAPMFVPRSDRRDEITL